MDHTTQGGEPVELFVFKQNTQTWRYTTGVNPVVYETKVYQPLPITHDSVQQSSDVFKNNLSITFPLSDEFARQFIISLPDFVTTITFLRGQNDQFTVFWKGRIVSANVNDYVITLDCESVFTSMKRPGLRACYERQCRHALYSQNCAVQSSLYRKNVQVMSAENKQITILGEMEKDGYYTSGIAESKDGAKRFIMKHEGQTLTLLTPFNHDVVNQEIILFPGCDHSKETCIQKFNNFDNFGGFPFIPNKNPFTSGRIA